MPTTTTTTASDETTSAPPTVSQVIGGFLQNALQHPKTTIQSILSGVYAITLLLMGMQTISPKVAGIIVSLNTIAKVGLGMSQSDGIQLPAGTSMKQTTQTTLQTPAAPPDATLPSKP